MRGGWATLPDGFVRVTAGRRVVVARADHVDDARTLVAEGGLYDAAARDLAARPLAGRGVAYAITLPASGARAVVRHNRHGGLLAPLTRDLFLPPTRAPRELAVSLRLTDAGVRTPPVLMYGVERVGWVCRRADLVTAEIVEGHDLATYMSADTPGSARAAAWAATRALLAALNAAGARHHDLNVKNVLLSPDVDGVKAWVLDVDRVTFAEPFAERVRTGNAARLLRSARKWRDERGAVFDERELAEPGAHVRSIGEPSAPRV
jgi:hypothetical protein